MGIPSQPRLVDRIHGNVKAREYRLAANPRWPGIMKASTGAAALILVWFKLAFELHQESKFAYNSWHP